MPNRPLGSLPSMMISAYRRIRVELDPPCAPVFIGVKKYACQTPGYGTGQNERMAYKNRLLGAIGGRAGISNNRMTASGFVGVFSGKGTMDDIATCLSLAARHNIFHHLPHRDSFLEAGMSTAQRLQAVADDYIGLDCNGFVGNWAIYNGVPHASASHPPLDWVLGRRIRTSLAEVAQYDIVVWANGFHIAMIERLGAIDSDQHAMSVDLAESSTGGMLIHPNTRIFLSSHTTPTARGGWQTRFSLRNDIHRTIPVVIASMAKI